MTTGSAIKRVHKDGTPVKKYSDGKVTGSMTYNQRNAHFNVRSSILTLRRHVLLPKDLNLWIQKSLITSLDQTR